ncbi:MAG: DNA mismatch repair endonuclease MutL [Elusimicrobiota bacterium]|jgi:DNA mismatch repair protein MutL|nr:DNA mismatch repair endonuclease MutL [Elusimicrobiota bacterium]
MNRIQLLDKQTASKIAAGEVIERPAGVLKELIENSLDAGATVLNIDIEKAGKKLIRVNDNGAGMAAEDLPMAVLRHTTSKISSFEDLDRLNTFGFRGEALFSVSAVGRVSIMSAPEGATAGAKIQVEGGIVTAQTAAPAVPGTTVEVRDLFFNTPARLKFLKSDTVERSRLLAAAEEAAMANPGVSFNVKTDGVKVYSLPAVDGGEAGLRRRLAKILGDEITRDLIYLQDERFGFEAFISPQDKLCANRDNLFFFVNKRPVGCKILQQAVYKAYQPYRAKDRHPCAVVFMQMPADGFDVNIHPQKKEIKFIDENGIFNFIYKKLSQAVLGQSGAQEIRLAAPAPAAAAPVPAPAQIPPVPAAADLSEIINQNISVGRPLFQVRDFEGAKQYLINEAAPPQTVRPQNAPAPAAGNTAGPAWWRPPYNYLGQLHNSYLVFENPAGLVLIDQHAAQERVFFEQYLNSLENNTTQKQPLMFPVSAEMPASAVENILLWQDTLDKAGFEISRFSQRTLLINTVPNILKFQEEDLRDFVISLAGVIGAPSKSDNKLKYRLISTMACKKSVKAGETMGKPQAEALLQNLKNCEDGLHCPHGRPALIALDIKEITKKFGRG